MKRQENIDCHGSRPIPFVCLLSYPLGSKYTDKKESKISSYIRKFRMEQLQSHIWLTTFSYMGKYLYISIILLGSPSSYLTLQLLHSEFPLTRGKFYFIFCQCTNCSFKAGKTTAVSSTEYTELQPLLSGVHLVMRVKLALAGEGGGCTPTPFYYIYHHQ